FPLQELGGVAGIGSVELVQLRHTLPYSTAWTYWHMVCASRRRAWTWGRQSSSMGYGFESGRRRRSASRSRPMGARRYSRGPRMAPGRAWSETHMRAHAIATG